MEQCGLCLNFPVVVADRLLHNLDLAALNTVMTEWTSSEKYTARIGTIKDGVGPNMYRLDATTVLGDTKSDGLTGGDGQDWLFVPKTGDTNKSKGHFISR